MRFLAGDNVKTIMRGTENGLAQSATAESASIFGGPHSGVVQFVWLDGHVTGVDRAIDDEALLGMSTIGGGELVRE